MMKMIERLLCAVLGHRYVVQRVFSATSRKIGCTRCYCEWGMNDSVRAFIPWDGDLEQLYRDIGQWPGQTHNGEVRGASRLAGDASASTVVLEGTDNRSDK